MNRNDKDDCRAFRRVEQQFRNSYDAWVRGTPEKRVQHAGILARLLREWMATWVATSPRGGNALYLKQHPLSGRIVKNASDNGYVLGVTGLVVPMPKPV